MMDRPLATITFLWVMFSGLTAVGITVITNSLLLCIVTSAWWITAIIGAMQGLLKKPAVNP